MQSRTQTPEALAPATPSPITCHHSLILANQAEGSPAQATKRRLQPLLEARLVLHLEWLVSELAETASRLHLEMWQLGTIQTAWVAEDRTGTPVAVTRKRRPLRVDERSPRGTFNAHREFHFTRLDASSSYTSSHCLLTRLLCLPRRTAHARARTAVNMAKAKKGTGNAAKKAASARSAKIVEDKPVCCDQRHCTRRWIAAFAAFRVQCLHITSKTPENRCSATVAWFR